MQEFTPFQYIRLYPRQNGKNVYAHVGLTKVLQFQIERTTNVHVLRGRFVLFSHQGEYDEALEWPFTLKHRITILDQSPAHYQDIVSRVWDPKV